jgi:hypothetical protein
LGISVFGERQLAAAFLVGGDFSYSFLAVTSLESTLAQLPISVDSKGFAQ